MEIAVTMTNVAAEYCRITLPRTRRGHSFRRTAPGRGHDLFYNFASGDGKIKALFTGSFLNYPHGMRAARTILFFVLPLAVAAVFAVIGNLGVLQPVDGRAYDRLLRIRPAAPAEKRILLVDIDEQPAALAGLLADGLVTLKEMDARYAVLDLPLAQKSPPALDPSVLRQTLPNALDREFAQVQENIQSLFDAIRRGAVRPRDAARYVSDLVGLVGMAKGRLFSAAMGIERDDDALLGQAAGFFGRVYVPLDLLPAADPATPPELTDLALQRQSIPAALSGVDPSRAVGGIRPAVIPVVRGARGGGFASEAADPDGVRRRTRLMAVIQGQHVGQLAFAALLDLLGNPSVELSPSRVLLRGAVLPGGAAAPISIPLAASGDMLLNWPGAVDDGFRHLPWSSLVRQQHLEDALVSDLRDLDAKGYLSYLRSSDSLLDVYEQGARLGRGMLAAGTDAEAEQWRAARAQFFSLCDQFLGGDAESRISSDADRQLQSGSLSSEEKSLVLAEKNRVSPLFDDARQILSRLETSRAALRESLSGSFCIVSLVPEPGSAREVLSPFDLAATDARASAALVSTILSGRFLREEGPGADLLVTAVLSLLLAFAVLRLKPLLSLVVGIAASGVSAVVLGSVFAVWGVFVAPSAPIAAVLVTGIALSSLKLAWKRGASRTVRAAFAGRVSTENLQVIDAARGRIAPDGRRRSVSVLCLAEKGFSARDSAEDPRAVVRQLRTYRAAVGEAILGLGGMIQGGGGGRLTAGFGAPVETEDHARRACLSALRVRALEKELNGESSALFMSRIGIDTGECLGGFLGTRWLPEYTLVGPPADFAARLEGLNGSFGTSIIISEEVREASGPGLVVRMLGTVAAGGRGRVRVYELCAERGAAAAPDDRLIAEFEEGLARYEKGELDRALKLFVRVLAETPGDGPASAYAERCRMLLGHPGLDATSFPW
jgi:adenylate cyclase